MIMWYYLLINSKYYYKIVILTMTDKPHTRQEGTLSIPHVPTAEVLGQSEAFLDFMERLSRVAKVDRPVLLIGERGTGKELAVSKLHYLSLRWQGPLVALNCAALSPTLIESELFGHEEGAFTGATRRRKGRFETASGGTLFLDEIGNIPVEVQEKILRVVEYRTFEQVGSSKPIQADVRIIGATNADLPTMMEEGGFKRDLLDRLSFEVLFLPPLRERKGDILLLANHFAARMAFELGRQEVPEFSEEAIAALERYPWPGNVRELKNVVERAVYRSDSAMTTDIVFDPFRPPFKEVLTTDTEKSEELTPSTKATPPEVLIDKPFSEAVMELEIRLLKSALKEARFNQRRAARLLGLTYHQFRGLYRKHRNQL
jgi:psp operon transcriptional activator